MSVTSLDAPVVQLAPVPIGWLWMPLTPSRAASLTAHEACTGERPAELAARLLDAAFALPVSEES